MAEEKKKTVLQKVVEAANSFKDEPACKGYGAGKIPRITVYTKSEGRPGELAKLLGEVMEKNKKLLKKKPKT